MYTFTWPSGKSSTTFTTSTSPAAQPAEAKDSVFGKPWYIPEIEESSVVRQFKFRAVEENKSLIVVTTHRGDEYSYEVDSDVAEDFYADLSQGGSPGHLWNELRDYVRSTPKPVAPVEMATVSISGPADQIGLIAAAAEAQGLTIF
jgi:hypothetical protein